MKFFILSSIVIFLLANIIVEYLRRDQDDIWEQPMSAYLAGSYGWIQSIAYILFSIGLILTGILTGQWIFYLASAGLIIVVVTKHYKEEKDIIEHIHVIGAGFAFLCTQIGILRELHNTIFMPLAWLPLIILGTTFFAWKPISNLIPEQADKDAVQEKLYTLFLIAAFTITVSII